MSLIFKATNPGATQPTWPQPTGWRHESYFDKPDVLSLSLITHLRAHETDSYLVCRLLLEKKKNKTPMKSRRHIETIDKKHYIE